MRRNSWRRWRIHVADGDLVADGRAGRRRLRAKRGGFADAGYSHGIRVDDQTVCDRYSEGNTYFYTGSDTQSGRSTPSGALIRGRDYGLSTERGSVLPAAPWSSCKTPAPLRAPVHA